MDPDLRSLVLHRANGICEYCHMPAQYDPAGFEIDHIIAEKHHGPTVPENLALACFPCK
jgi:5-methylcytosine-specific restriction endonuclease McrA